MKYKRYIIVLVFFVILCGAFLINSKMNNHIVPNENVSQAISKSELILDDNNNKEQLANKTKYYAPVLAYHHIGDRIQQNSYYVSPAIFDKQLTYLEEKGYSVISMDKFYEAAKHNGTLPDKPVVLTFDDGNPDNYTNAFPILQKHNMTATFFIKLNNVHETGPTMTWNKLKEMSDAGMIIGSHTVNHDTLTALPDDVIINELVQSKKVIENKTGTKVLYFCYPGGIYNDKIIAELKKAGYLMAFTTKHKVNQEIKDNNSLYTIPRVHIDDEMPTFIDWIQGKNLN